MRHWATHTIVILTVAVAFSLPGWAQQKPYMQEQVQGLVEGGVGDESGAKLIEQRGIAFSPTESFLEALRNAGASEAFIRALREANRPASPAPAPAPAAGVNAPLDKFLVFDLVISTIPSARVVTLIQLRGIAFIPDSDLLSNLRALHAASETVEALRKARTYPEDAEALEKHAQLVVEDYSALLRKNPQNDTARYVLGQAYDTMGNRDGEVELWREALRLNPNHAFASTQLGVALGHKGDWNGDIAEQREALRLDPNNAFAHNEIGLELSLRGDWDGAIAEFREALRLDPNNAAAHNELGAALERKGDRQAALQEYRTATGLDPKNTSYQQNYQRLRALREANRPAGIGATRTSPPAEATTPRASVTAPTTFTSYKIEVHPGELKDKADEFSLTSAEVCAVSGASKLCYTPPVSTGAGSAYGLDPHATKVSLRESDDALLFLPSEFTGTASANTLLALLQIRNGHLVNILPLTTLSVLSDYGLWKEPDISQAPIVVVANYVWGEGESRMGSKHRFYVESFTMQPSGDYGRSDNYVTTNKYDPDVENIGVLSKERPAILARLRRATASSVETHRSQAVLTGRDQITSLLNDWVDSFKQKDVARQVDCYAPQVDIYYRKHNVSRAFVEADKSRAIARLAETRKFELSNVNVSFDSAEVATVTFDKSWDTTLTSSRRFAGSEMERLGLAFVDGRWKIRSEEEVQIYHVAK